MRLPLRGLPVAVAIIGLARATAAGDCNPCADAARSTTSYAVVVGSAGRELLTRAIAHGDAAAAESFRARCRADSSGDQPRYTCTTLSADTLERWRAAIERFGAESGAAGDSAGGLGIATLAAIDRATAHPA